MIVGSGSVFGETEPIGEIDWEPLVEVVALLIPPNFQTQEEISEIPLQEAPTLLT